MHILALADIHGSYDTMEAILNKEPSIDVIIIDGDLTTHGGTKEAEEAIQRVQSFGKRVFAVCGNMDPPALDELFVKLGVSINAKGVMLDDVGFFGVSAAPTSFLRTPNEISEEEIMRRAEQGLKDVVDAPWKIFVPHAPPLKTKVDKIFIGRHVGSSAVKNFIVHHQPDVTICGHIHEARGQDTIGKTKIINCGAAAKGFYGLIEVKTDIVVQNKSYHQPVADEA